MEQKHSKIEIVNIPIVFTTCSRYVGPIVDAEVNQDDKIVRLLRVDVCRSCLLR